jgi:hypothetical protein
MGFRALARLGRAVALAAAVLVPAGRLRAQTYPLLERRLTDLISAEISGDAAYDHIRVLSNYHRPQGSDTLYVAAQYVERMARAAGLDDVTLIKQRSLRTLWNPGGSDLWIVGDPPERLASSLQNRIHLADRSRPADVTADLIDVGPGTDSALGGRSVAGKIVVTTGDLNAMMAEMVQRRGAAGLIWYPDPYTPSRGYLSYGVDQPNQVPWITLAVRTVDGREPTFAFVLSLRGGIALHNRIARATAPVRVHATVKTELGSAVHPEPWMPLVEAVIPGTEPNLHQDVVLTGHLQEEQHSANDDASGVASVLEIGRAFVKLIRDGQLPRPRRTIRFWWTTENDSERRYFADHPDKIPTLWVDINQDMVGADQSLDVMRTQDATRLPASRFHFLNDVMEAVIEYLVAGNSSNITQYRNGYGLYPKPLLSHNGTMHRYNAQAVWYQGDSDHESFLNAPIGIPAITLTNSPDRYIHSNLDDLFQIDRTQLGRNAVAAALMAYTMATAGPAGFPLLAAEVVGRGQQRLGLSQKIALQLLSGGGDPPGSYEDAVNQIRYAVDRERRALRSLGEIDPSAPARVAPLLLDLDRREAEALRELAENDPAKGASGNRRPAPALSPAETALAGLRPVVAGSPLDFLLRHNDIEEPAGMNGYLAREILAAIDGKRTGLELYRLAVAEVREAGTYYYGPVSPESVLELLHAAEKVKLFRLQP